MTIRELKRALRQIEEQTNEDWDDSVLIFQGAGGTAFRIEEEKTLFQNAPFRAVIMKAQNAAVIPIAKR